MNLLFDVTSERGLGIGGGKDILATEDQIIVYQALVDVLLLLQLRFLLCIRFLEDGGILNIVT